MNQHDLIRKIAKETKINQDNVRFVFDSLEGVLLENLKNEEETKLFPGVIFTSKYVASRPVMDPRDGRIIPSKPVIKCNVKVLKSFKRLVNEDLTVD